MSDRLLREDELLLQGQYYKFWLPSPRIPQGQAFAEYLEARQLELVDSRALNANAVTVVVRALGEKTYRQAAANMVGGLSEVTHWGLNVDQAVIYATDGPPGIVDRAVAPIAQAAERFEAGASAVGQEAAATTRSIRGAADALGTTIENLSSAARALAIGVPIAAAVIALGYVLVTWRKK